MYAVAGVTGNTGAYVAQALLEKDADIRVIVRDAAKGDSWKEKGADIALADLSDREALTKALTGVQGAYLLLPPHPTEDRILEKFEQLAKGLRTAVDAAGAPDLVLLSSVGAHLPKGTGPIQSLAKLEQVFADYSGNVTFLRPCYFMENFAQLLHPITLDGVLPSMLQPLDRQISMVSVRDIGEQAARLLMEGGNGHQVVELEGPASYSPLQAAAVFADLLGREVNAFPVPQEQWVPSLTGVGLSEDMSRLLAEMYGAINADEVAFEGAARRGEIPLEQALAALLNG